MGPRGRAEGIAGWCWLSYNAHRRNKTNRHQNKIDLYKIFVGNVPTESTLGSHKALVTREQNTFHDLLSSLPPEQREYTTTQILFFN